MAICNSAKPILSLRSLRFLLNIFSNFSVSHAYVNTVDCGHTAFLQLFRSRSKGVSHVARIQVQRSKIRFYVAVAIRSSWEWVGPTRQDILDEANRLYTRGYPKENKRQIEANAQTALAYCIERLNARMSKQPTIEAKVLIGALSPRSNVARAKIAHGGQAISAGKAEN